MSPSSGSSKFTIVSSSGELSLAQPLDYEDVKQYMITIEAHVSEIDIDIDTDIDTDIYQHTGSW